MALVIANRVKETTTTTGTGTVTLLGASTGFQSFAVIGNANTAYYTIAGQTTSEWEVGIGTYTSAGTTLARTTILSSSNAGSAVNFSAGTKDVFVTYPSEKSVNLDANGNATALGTIASGNLANATGYPGTSALVTVGALNAGSITSGFGAIDVGADAITGGAGSFTTLAASGTSAFTGAVGIGGASASNIAVSTSGTPTSGSGSQLGVYIGHRPSSAATGYSGLYTGVRNAASGTITNGYGLYVENFSTAGGTLVNNYGVYIEAQSGGTTINTGLHNAGTSTLTGAVTLGAGLTLGGTVAGGGNQLNNVIIGTSTPLAGSFTTVTASGDVIFSAGDRYIRTNSVDGADNLQIGLIAGSAASNIRGGGIFVSGNEHASAGWVNIDTGAVAGSTLRIRNGNTTIADVTSTGLAVTGVVTATGNITGAAGSFTTLAASGAVTITGAGVIVTREGSDSAATNTTVYTSNAANNKAAALQLSASGNSFDTYIYGAASTWAKRLSVSDTGLAVTGSLSSSAAAAAYTGLQVGTGNGVNAGLIIGNIASAYGAIWPTAVTPSTTNYSLKSNGSSLFLNATADVYVRVNDGTNLLAITGTGLAVTGSISSTTGANFATSSGGLNIGSGTLQAWAGKATKYRSRSYVGELDANSAIYLSNNMYYDGSNWRTDAAGAGGFVVIDQDNMQFHTGTNGGALGVSTATKRAEISTTGLAVTGSISATTTITATGNISADNATLGGNLNLPLTGMVRFDGASGNDYFVAPSNNTVDLYVNGTLTTRATANLLAVTGSLSSTTGANFATSSGNVGIGLSDPSDIFQVRKATNRNLRVVTPPASLTGIGLQSLNDAVSATLPLSFDASLFYFNVGNVGIGTTSPLFKFHLNGTSNAPSLSAVAGIAAFDTSSSVELTMGGYTADPYGFWLQTKDNQNGGVGNGVSYPLLLNPISGNVGIGTASPGAKLEVAYANIGSDKGIRINNTAGKTFALHSGIQGISENGFAIRDVTAGVNRLVISDAGSIAIGTNSFVADSGILTVSSGITFPATQVASTDANTLDDYEEGNWTNADLTFDSGSVTLSNKIAQYVKKGREVSVFFSAIIATISSPSGQAFVGSLPFTAGGGGTASIASAIWAQAMGSSTNTMLQARVAGTETRIRLSKFKDGVQAHLGADFIVGAEFSVQTTYNV